MVNLNGKSVVVRIPTELQSESNETSPLNQRGRDNNSDVSSSTSAVTSEQCTKKLITADMDQSKNILLRMAIDFALFCCVVIPILAFVFMGKPYERGFFCYDESLMHPYLESTIKHWMLFVFGLIVPILIILTVEIIRGQSNLDGNSDNELHLLGRKVTLSARNIYRYIGLFCFGGACCQLITDIAKYSIGRLRPHFISVCQPIMNDGTDCKNPINFHRYIEEFTCGSSQATENVLKDMRMSFPSANSSFSFYTMIFCALYLQSRLCWKGSKLLKYFLQFIFLMLAWFTSLSRISDYKHHWSDVLAGAVLGVFFAVITVFIAKTNSHQEKLSCTKLNSCKTNNV